MHEGPALRSLFRGDRRANPGAVSSLYADSYDVSVECHDIHMTFNGEAPAGMAWAGGHLTSVCTGIPQGSRAGERISPEQE